MKITMEQYKELGNFYLDDFPIKCIDDTLGLGIFNSLPTHICRDIVSWGFSDTPTRESIFVELLGRIGFTPEDYYKSDIAKQYFENGIELTEEQKQHLTTAST